MFGINQQKAFGLDIGSTAVKLVQLQREGDDYTVQAAWQTEILRSENPETHKHNIIAAVRKCVESAGIKTRYAVCGVSGPDVIVRNFSFPLLPKEEIDQAVLMEAAQVCPFEIEQGTVVYDQISCSEEAGSEKGGLAVAEEKTTGVMVAAPNKVIKAKQQLVKSSGLNCAIMDADNLALINCMNRYQSTPSGHAVVLVNVGNKYSNVIITTDNGVPFVRDLNNAGMHIVEAISQDLHIPSEKVCTYLKDPKKADDDTIDITSALHKACRSLLADISETIRYYKAHICYAITDRINICGGFSLVNGFVDFLDNEFPEAVDVWNPFDKIPCVNNVIGGEYITRSGPSFAVAAGLAMRTI